MREMGTVLTKDSITTSIEYLNDRLLTSHEDGYIRLWDIRSPQTPTNTYKAHSKLVSSVEFNPNKSHIFCSVIFYFISGIIRYYCKSLGFPFNFPSSKYRNSS